MKKIDIGHEYYNDGYYHFKKDIEDYPEAVFIIVWSRRGPGKTYSGLRYCYANKVPLLYVKRTQDDVDFIMKSDNYGIDDKKNPFFPINRDFDLHIKARSEGKGRGIFYEDIEGTEDQIRLIGRVESFNNTKKVKGFDMSDIELMIMDEFIPQVGEIVRHDEGKMLLNLYMTILRDRMQRGRGPLKMALFANTDQISTPITRELEIIDDMAEMNRTGENIKYLKNRKILLHHITEDECPNFIKEDEGIFAAMAGTQWADINFKGLFAGVDFSNIVKLNLKKFYPVAEIIYKRKPIYLYRHKGSGMFYLSSTRSNHTVRVYDLERDSDKKALYLDYIFDLQAALTEDKLKSEKYSYYDLVVNYKQYFKF